MHMSRNENLNAIIENDHIEYWSLVNASILQANNVNHWIKKHIPLFSFIDSHLISELKPQYNDSENKFFQNLLLKKLSYHDFFPAVWTGFAF